MKREKILWNHCIVTIIIIIFFSKKKKKKTANCFLLNTFIDYFKRWFKSHAAKEASSFRAFVCCWILFFLSRTKRLHSLLSNCSQITKIKKKPKINIRYELAASQVKQSPCNTNFLEFSLPLEYLEAMTSKRLHGLKLWNFIR